jgi:hypothetical protein
MNQPARKKLFVEKGRIDEDFFNGCSTNDVISKLNDLGPNFQFICEVLEDGGLRLEYGLERMETDEEYNQRISHLEYMRQRQEESDRKLYEKLKAKFEKGESND